MFLKIIYEENIILIFFTKLLSKIILFYIFKIKNIEISFFFFLYKNKKYKPKISFSKQKNNFLKH